MKTFKKFFITELFDNSDVGKLIKPSNISKYSYDVQYSAKIEKDKIVFNASKLIPKNLNIWTVDFAVNGKYSFDGYNKNYIKIYSAVVEMLKKFIKENDPQKVTFSAWDHYDDKSRETLYLKMLKYKLPKNYTFDAIGNHFTIEKK